jgi:hypothetical protein
VLKEGVVKVLSSKVGVTSGSLDGEDSTGDGKERNIEGSSSQVEDEDVLLLLGLLVESVSDGSGGGLVDDSEDVKSSDGSGVLGGESLGVVEVGGDAEAVLGGGRSDSERILTFFSEGEDESENKNTYVTTAFLTSLPSLASAISFILMRTMDEISWGEKVLVSLRY